MSIPAFQRNTENGLKTVHNNSTTNLSNANKEFNLDILNIEISKYLEFYCHFIAIFK